MINKTEYSFIKKIGTLSDDCVIVFDTQHLKFIYANLNFIKLFKIRETALFKNANVLIPFVYAEDGYYLNEKYNELIKNGYINTTEFRLVFAGQNIKHISCDAYLIENDRYIVGYIKDITKVKQHEDYLVKYTAQKDTLLDMLTHNLGGPLLLSRDLIDSLHKKYSEKNRRAVQKIMSILMENTQQCIDIVNDFLREEHYESANVFVRKTRFDVIEKINATVDKLRVMNKDKKFSVTSSVNNLNINSDPVKFFQIIHNILSNSIKFTTAKGIIKIEVKEFKSYYTITISDNGIGIHPSLKNSIFNSRIVGQTGLKGEKSSGLGLSIAKKLIDLMEGKISFKSKLGVGTQFKIQLPKT